MNTFLKKAIFLFVFSLLWMVGEAQVVTIDPTTTAAVSLAQGMENSRMDDIKSKQNAIQLAQTATIAAVQEVNAIQNKIYKGLTQVSGVVKNAYQVKEIYQAVSDIMSYETDMLNEAKKNPIALAFAYKTQTEVVNNAALVSADVANIVLAASSDILMDAGERDNLLYKILLDVNKIKALSAYAYYQVKLAVMKGIFRSLNPFQGYVDLDGNIVKSILADWKH